MVNGEPVLVEAMSRALSPWSLRVVLVTAEHYPVDMAGALGRAHEIAATSPAAAVVWITSVQGGGASDSLWLYDAATEQIVVRPLTTPGPLDEPTAAAIALSVKTLLRATTVAPEKEQVAREAAPAASTAATSSPPAPPVERSPDLRTAPQERPAPPAVTRLRLEASVGLRALARDTLRVEPRPGVALSFWPSVLRARLGLAVSASGGPGVSLQTSRFAGSYSDLTLGGGGRLRVPLPPVEFELGLGAAAHFTGIQGDIRAPNMHASASQVDPSIDSTATFVVPLSGRVDLGLTLGLSYFFRYQSYFVGTEPVFAVSPFEPSTALRLAVTLN